jgi:hypothetical protein
MPFRTAHALPRLVDGTYAAGWDRFRPPPDLKGRLDLLAAPFGGAERLEALLSPQQLAKLLTFPGFIYVVSPWAIEVNLADHGYVENTPYSVLDERSGAHLYTAVSVSLTLQRVVSDRRVHVPYPVSGVFIEELPHPVEEDGTVWVTDRRDGAHVEVVVPAGRFGVNPEDQELVTSRPHGSLVQVLYDGSLGPVTGLLLICNQRPPAYRQAQVRRWLAEVETAPLPSDSHELFLYVECLRREAPITVSFVPGSWSQQLGYTQILHHPEAHHYNHPGHAPLALSFARSGWLTFSQLGTQLVIRDLRGKGLRRLRESSDCTYYLQLDNLALGFGQAELLYAEAMLGYRLHGLPRSHFYLGLTFVAREAAYETCQLTLVLEF